MSPPKRSIRVRKTPAATHPYTYEDAPTRDQLLNESRNPSSEGAIERAREIVAKVFDDTADLFAAAALPNQAASELKRKQANEYRAGQCDETEQMEIAIAALQSSPPIADERPGNVFAEGNDERFRDATPQEQAIYKELMDQGLSPDDAAESAWGIIEALNKLPPPSDDERLRKACEALFAGGFVEAGMRGTLNEWRQEFEVRTDAIRDALSPSPIPVSDKPEGEALDRRTGRPLGDHGTAKDAINYVLSGADLGCHAEDFLRCWQQGDLDEWPDFYGSLPTDKRPA